MELLCIGAGIIIGFVGCFFVMRNNKKKFKALIDIDSIDQLKIKLKNLL